MCLEDGKKVWHAQALRDPYTTVKVALRGRCLHVQKAYSNLDEHASQAF
jgi:hypothetical protein